MGKPQERFWNSISRAWLGIIALYMIGWFSYAFAIFFTSGFTFNPFWRTGLDYLLKGLFSWPVWWFIFRRNSQKEALGRYLMHLITFPLWLAGWILTFYSLCEWFDLGRLGGYGVGWDIYIPALFYIIQFGIFHLYDESKRLVRQKTRAAELAAISIKNELAALKAQLNPHFLYNVFNTINASLPPEQEETRELVATLSDLFRYQLRATRSETVPLQQELDFVKDYLSLEKARFQERLQVQWDIDERVRHAQLPPMLLQPLVENAIKHGIGNKMEGGTVAVMAKPVEENLVISISDDGPGMTEKDAGTGEGVGLSNVSRILKNLYDADLILEENSKGGLTVSFNIPLNRSNKKT